MRKRTRFATLTTAAFVVVVTAAWLFHPSATSSSDRTKPQQDLALDARSKGDPDAPITVYEVSDFQCPYCRQFWEETLPEIDREYIRTGKIRLTFINLPLAQLHPNAPAAHEFAMCAAQQNRFWPVHDLLYSHQATWAKLDDPANYFMALADSAALARDSLMSCFDSGAVRGLIEAEVQFSMRAGVSSTPSFIIGQGVLSGAQPIEVWRPILDSLLAEKSGGR